MPVGPGDRLEWVRKSASSALKQGAKLVIYDNSERQDLFDLIQELKSLYGLTYVRGERMRKVNMAALRNRLLSLAGSDRFMMLDSDVVLGEGFLTGIFSFAEVNEASMVWAHYAYSEEELKRPLGRGEENPNLGCAVLKASDLRTLGGFDERYERDEDVWLYSKLKRLGKRVLPYPGRCLHLNRSHLREDLHSSLREARRNLWRAKYDMMLVVDGLSNSTFLTSYAYYLSYYVVAALSVLYPLSSVLFLPLIVIGAKYHGGLRGFALNLVPGLALTVGAIYGIPWALMRSRRGVS
jgi:hypothetical protein